MAKWKSFRCGSCRGTGMVSVYSQFDFLGAGDCSACNNGEVWVSEHDRLAQWPGGPFLGSWPGKYAEVPMAIRVDLLDDLFPENEAQ